MATRTLQLLALTVLALGGNAVAQEPVDPVAGVWKGLVRGDGGFLSNRGAPATFLFVRDADGALGGRAIFQGMEVEQLRVAVQGAGDKLTFSGTIASIPVEAELELSGERMEGVLLALGSESVLELRRLSLEVLEPPPTGGAPTALADVSEADWAADLYFLRDYMPQVHADAYHSQSAEVWRASVDAAVASLAGSDAHARAVAVACVVAGVGDAHTELNWREVPGFGSVPIEIRQFADGVFVTGVFEHGGDALGARIVRVGAAPVETALARVNELFAAENDSWRVQHAPGMLAAPGLLAALGLTDSPERVPLTLEHAGGERVEVSIGFERDGAWLAAPDPRYDPVPLWRTNTSRPYWFEVLPERSAVYLAYNSCREDPSRSMQDFLGQVLAAFDAAGAERLVLDLRNNSGGNSGILTAQLDRLREHTVIGAPGGLVGLIGPRTYSSGMWAAYELRDLLGATLVGEPTGGKPNSYGEVRWFRLPHTKLQVMHSTKYFHLLESEDPDSIAPAVVVPLASSEYLGGADPVLERALE